MNVRESSVIDGKVEIGGFQIPLPRSAVAALGADQARLRRLPP